MIFGIKNGFFKSKIQFLDIRKSIFNYNKSILLYITNCDYFLISQIPVFGLDKILWHLKVDFVMYV